VSWYLGEGSVLGGRERESEKKEERGDEDVDVDVGEVGGRAVERIVKRSVII
jgi:hypothetical protein